MIKLIIACKLLGSIMDITEYESLQTKVNSLKSGETFWLMGKLSDSYENQIFSQVLRVPVGKSVEEYRKEFQKFGLKLEHIEIQREVAIFNDINDLRVWIYSQMQDNILMEECLLLMQQKGWINLGDEKIRIPIKKLVVRLKL